MCVYRCAYKQMGEYRGPAFGKRAMMHQVPPSHSAFHQILMQELFFNAVQILTHFSSEIKPCNVLRPPRVS